MRPGLLLKDSLEKMCVFRCYYTRCQDQYFANSLEYQLHYEELHDKMYAWYEEEVQIHDGNYENPKWTKEIRITNGWVTPSKTKKKIIRRAILSKKYRPMRRMLVTEAEMENRNKHRTCHCGKPVAKGRLLYCSDSCQVEWWSKTDDVGHHKDKFLRKHTVCEICGKGPDSIYHPLEMDHIIAIIFGGHPWHEDNLQALCYYCHKKKTKSDMGILAWWKRECKYDIGLVDREVKVIAEGQKLLEAFVS